MRRGFPGLLCVLLVACAHRTAADRPIVVTEEHLTKLEIALPVGPKIRIDDSDCDGEDRSRIEATFSELESALLEQGFSLVPSNDADLLLTFDNHIQDCTFDGMIHGTSSVVLKDQTGRIVEHVRLFPLWPEGLVLQLRQSERLVAFAERGPALSPPPPPPPPPPPVIAPTRTSSVSKARLTQYLRLRLEDAGVSEAPSLEMMRLGTQCVLTARIIDRTATERTACNEDALASAIDRVAKRLATPAPEP